MMPLRSARLLSDAETGTHMSQPAKEVTFEDVVEYEGLKRARNTNRPEP